MRGSTGFKGVTPTIGRLREGGEGVRMGGWVGEEEWLGLGVWGETEKMGLTNEK